MRGKRYIAGVTVARALLFGGGCGRVTGDQAPVSVIDDVVLDGHPPQSVSHEQMRLAGVFGAAALASSTPLTETQLQEAGTLYCSAFDTAATPHIERSVSTLTVPLGIIGTDLSKDTVVTFGLQGGLVGPADITQVPDSNAQSQATLETAFPIAVTQFGDHFTEVAPSARQVHFGKS